MLARCSHPTTGGRHLYRTVSIRPQLQRRERTCRAEAHTCGLRKAPCVSIEDILLHQQQAQDEAFARSFHLRNGQICYGTRHLGLYRKFPPSLKDCVVLDIVIVIAPSTAVHADGDSQVAYADTGYKFYFPDQRFADGSLAGEQMSGEALAERMLALVEDPVQQAWYHTFVQGKGYVDFEQVDRQRDRAREWN